MGPASVALALSFPIVTDVTPSPLGLPAVILAYLAVAEITDVAWVTVTGTAVTAPMT